MEQWEIDLRNQLENSNSNNLKPINQSVPQKAKSDSFLYFCFIILGIAILLAFNYKTNGFVKEKIDEWNSQELEVEEKPVEENKPIEEEKTEDIYLEKIKNIENDILELKISNKWVSDRVTVIGMVLNENFSIIRNNNDKQEIILLEKDWKMSRKPSHIQFSERSQEIADKYSKDQ